MTALKRMMTKAPRAYRNYPAVRRLTELPPLAPADVFRRIPKNYPRFGRRNPLDRMPFARKQPLPLPYGWARGIRGFLPYGIAFGLAEYAWDVYSRKEGRKPVLPPNWEWCVGPATDCAGYTWVTAPYFAAIGSCGLSMCLGGQAAMSPGFVSGQVFAHYVRNYDRGKLPPRSVILGSARALTGAGGELPYVAAPVVWEAPNVWVADALLQPVDWFAPQPRAIPYHLIPRRQNNPDRAPSERTEVGPDPLPKREPEVHRTRNTFMAFTPVVGGPPVITRDDENPKRRKREKERKAKMSKGLAMMMAAANAATEAADAVEAIYKALPADITKRAWIDNGGNELTPQQQAALVYKHYDQVDLSQAAANLIVNQWEDMLIGRINSANRPLAQQMRSLVTAGFGAGQRQGLQKLAMAKIKARERAKKREKRRAERIKREQFRQWGHGRVLTDADAAAIVDARTDKWLSRVSKRK